MDQTLSGSVGAGGMNRNVDVKKVQALLNRMPLAWGGPMMKLVEDGVSGPKTQEAIKRFQWVQLGTLFTPDAKVDPQGRTLKRMNHIANSGESPGQAVMVSVEPLSHVRQFTDMGCWAASGTMLVRARDRSTVPVETVMNTADANDPGRFYMNQYKTDRGLAPADTGRYVKAIGLRVGPPVSLTLQGWRSKLSINGAIGVVGLMPFVHVRVVSEMKGDGSSFGTFMTIHDPLQAASYTEVFVTFAQRYEAAATGGDRMDQIWHK